MRHGRDGRATSNPAPNFSRGASNRLGGTMTNRHASQAVVERAHPVALQRVRMC